MRVAWGGCLEEVWGGGGGAVWGGGETAECIFIYIVLKKSTRVVVCRQSRSMSGFTESWRECQRTRQRWIDRSVYRPASHPTQIHDFYWEILRIIQ